jgi:hypothetical protein
MVRLEATCVVRPQQSSSNPALPWSWLGLSAPWSDFYWRGADICISRIMRKS